MSELNFGAALKAATQVKSMIANLRSRRDELQAEEEALTKRNEVLLSMPVSHEEKKQFVFDFIDREAAKFLPRAAKSLAGVASPNGLNRPKPANGTQPKHLCLRDVDYVLSGGFEQAEHVLGHTNFFHHPEDGVHIWAAPRLYYFFGDIIKKKIADNFDELVPQSLNGSSNEGPSIVEKRAEINEACKRIAEIQAELTVIRHSLNDLSIQA